MQIEGRTALVTGANRGLGRHLAQQLRDRGASVYAAARNPASVDLDGVTPIALDVTDPASVEAAAATTRQVSILVNNAGSSTGASLLAGDVADIRLEMDTHFFGTLAVIRAFTPQLAEHEQSSVLNILSVFVLAEHPSLRRLLRGQVRGLVSHQRPAPGTSSAGTRVTALHVGYMDTDMARHVDAAKSDPADIARIAIDGIQAGQAEIIADDISRTVLASLSGGVADLYPQAA